MQNHVSVIGLIFFLLVISSSLALAIDVSGNVSGVWGPEDNPYNVVGDLQVPDGDTLIIEPGCYINFTGHYKFNIDSLASLQATGTETDSIIFTASNTVAGWFGLRFNYGDSSCRLSYCNIQWGRAADHTQEPDNKGGGIYCANTHLTIDRCNFSNNWAWEGWGGAIYGAYSDLIIQNNIIYKNHSGRGGAGIWLEHSTALIDSNIIENDSTFYILGGEWGGGISFSNSNAMVSNNKICHNFSGFIGAGVLISYNSHINLINNVIAHNRSWDSGAGLYITVACSVYFNNCSIYSNLMSGGPSEGKVNITSGRSHLVISNCLSYDGHISIAFGISDTIINSILWGDSQVIEVYQETLTVRYSDIQGGWPGIGNIDADPLFVYADTGNFHLSWANWPFNDSGKSPCIDAGDPASPLDPDGTRADMGAFYFDQRGGGIDDVSAIPQTYRLMQNYPNPFNSSTIIRYHLLVASSVTIDIYDILGRKVKTLLDVKEQAGSHQVILDADGFSSGLYFYRLQAGDESHSRHMTVIK